MPLRLRHDMVHSTMLGQRTTSLLRCHHLREGVRLSSPRYFLKPTVPRGSGRIRCVLDQKMAPRLIVCSMLGSGNVIAAAGSGTAHAAVAATIAHVAVTAVAIASGACLSTKVDFLQPQEAEHPDSLVLDGVDLTGYAIFNDAKVQKAINFARKAHQGQLRRTGEPYVTHCIHTGKILAALVPSSGDRAVETVMAGILHDVVDDTSETLHSVEKEFGDEVTRLVAGVSKLSYINQLLRRHRRKSVNQRTLIPEEANKLRIMLLGMVDDPRVVLIKLADRLHNMRTIYALSLPKAQAVAEETLAVWCSLASRLGVLPLKAELEDLCFAVLQPDKFQDMQAKLASMWSCSSKVRNNRRMATKADHLVPLNTDANTISKHSNYKDLGNMRDLLQAVIPFDILLDRRKRTKFLNNFRQCSEVSNTKAKVVTDAGIALASLVVCEEALEQELFISTSYIPGMELTLYSRLKSLYSIYCKMKRKDVDITQIYDARALRVIVGDRNGKLHGLAVENCYSLLNIVHRLWYPIDGEFDDYIINPKPSGYQSLHTAVHGPHNSPLEVQIRTQRMHECAEFGLAAHWLYKETDNIMRYQSDVNDSKIDASPYKSKVLEDEAAVQNKYTLLKEGHPVKHPHSMDSESSSQLLDPNRMSLLKSTANHTGYLGQGNPGSVSAALQQIQAQTQQTTDIKNEVNLGAIQRSLPMDPSSIYGSGIRQSKSGLGPAGLNTGVGGIPLKGWPLTGIDQLRPNLGPQVQKSFPSTQSQFNLLPLHQQQQIIAQAQAQAQGSVGSQANYGDMDPRRFTGLPRENMNGKDVLPSGTDGSLGSPIQSSSPKLRPDQAEYQMKLKMTQMQHNPSAQQMQDQLQQQSQQNRKRKHASSSGAANSTGTGNTAVPSNSSPSTPTHTAGDASTIAGSLPHVNMQKTLGMYGSDVTDGLASSSNQLDDIGQFHDVGSLDDNVDSFLSNDDVDTRDIFAALKTAEQNADLLKNVNINEVRCNRTSNSKVICCHFSSDGKLLASAGHEKKALIWNTNTLQTESTPELHKHIITDVRFRANSTQLATSSFDRTIRLWDASDPSYCKNTFEGHSSHVTSLDFHPKKTDLLCSCDGNGEIRFWSATNYSYSRVSKGGTTQVRFQPKLGLLLAAAAHNVVSIFDVETDRQTRSLQGHTSDVHSVCWDATGDYLASVSHDFVKVWSINTGDCIQELRSTGNNFHSCVFHPTSSNILIIGGYQTLELWERSMNKCVSVQAHDNLIAALAQSPVTGMVASASHDKSVKLWK